MSGWRGGFVPISSSTGGSPRGLIDAVSEIQRYHIIERTGQDIPSDFLTVRGTLAFFRDGDENRLPGGGRFWACFFLSPGEYGRT